MKGKPKFNDAKAEMEYQWKHQPMGNPIKYAQWEWTLYSGLYCHNMFDRNVS